MDARQESARYAQRDRHREPVRQEQESARRGRRDRHREPVRQENARYAQRDRHREPVRQENVRHVPKGRREDIPMVTGKQDVRKEADGISVQAAQVLGETGEIPAEMTWALPWWNSRKVREIK